MKKILFIAFVLVAFKSEAQTANAGSDVTIYLSSTNTATLDGSASSGSTFQWTEIKDSSWDYLSGATITNATSKTATVSPLPQGVFYFELTVNGTLKDTMKVMVDYAPPPANSTLILNFNMSDTTISDVINKRDDTTSYFSVADHAHSQTNGDANGKDWFYYRGRMNDLYIDRQGGKLITTIEDGYGDRPDGYTRSEVQPADYSFTADTNHIYMVEYKAYLPQDYNYLVGGLSWHTILAMLQIHSYTETPTVFSNGINEPDSIHMADYNDPTSTTTQVNYSSRHNFYNKTHTIRLIFKEGSSGNGFIKQQLDGNTVYYRGTGQIGSNAHDDFLKFAGLYDYNQLMVNYDSLSRGHNFKLVTESFKVYTLTDTSAISSPTINAGGNDTAYANTDTLTATYSVASGHTATFSIVKESGPAGGNVTTPTGSTTTITNLTEGDYRYGFNIHQDDGQTGYDYKLLHVVGVLGTGITRAKIHANIKIGNK